MPDQTKGLLSPFLRGRRFNKALPFIEGKVLDYGCGVGLLANYIPDDRYVGVDTDSISIDMAKKLNPSYRFFKIMSSDYKEIKEFCPFDTIVMLAVIEHIKKPEKVLLELAKILGNNGKIIITTPHPISAKIHDFGSKMGIFSREAEQQHEKLYDYQNMNNICSEINMRITKYDRFLFKMNQLFLIKHK